MTAVSDPQIPRQQEDTDVLLRLGGWLFARRSWLPVPLALALLLVTAGRSPDSAWLAGLGALIVGGGELVRLWAVHHIGVISRTRSDRLGPLVTSGPFGLVRNPLYLGNVALWVGFAVSARLLWMAPLVLLLLSLEYHAIVQWEERLLESRRGDEYRVYCTLVPRWWPRMTRARGLPAVPPVAPYSWRLTLFSERGTLIAIAVGFALLALKSRF